MGLLIVAGALLVGFGTAYVASDDVRYLTRAGFEETRILTAREPITRVADDSTQPAEVRAAASLVIEVRSHAARFGLEANETYTTYSDVGRDTLLLVLTASPTNCLCPVTWRYPFVGRVPYRGYFDFEAGRQAAREHAERGFDVHLRPSAAFSTLGWFNDPLLSTAITTDSVELAALVFHEIAHNTVWVPDAVDFNESFAQWVGYRAAARFFMTRGDTALAVRALDRWHDEQILGRYYDALVTRLEALYADRPTGTALAEGRAAIEAWSRDTLASPFGQGLRTIAVTRLAERPLNNASLIGVRLYRTGLDLFEEWYWRNGSDLGVSIYTLRQLVDGATAREAFLLLEAAVRPASSGPPNE
jgi:predicted aminopeptidase